MPILPVSFLLFLYFWQPWVFAAALGISIVVVHGLLVALGSLLWNVDSRGCGLQ